MFSSVHPVSESCSIQEHKKIDACYLEYQKFLHANRDFYYVEDINKRFYYGIVFRLHANDLDFLKSIINNLFYVIRIKKSVRERHLEKYK